MSLNITYLGNKVNVANGIVVTDGSNKLPALDGSQLTNLPNAAGYDVQQFVPVTAGTVTIVASVENILASINPAGTLATLTVDLPPSPMDGQLVTVSSSQTITALTMATVDSSTILGTGTEIQAGASLTFIYDLTNTNWRRVL